MSFLTSLTLTELADRMASGQVSSREAVEAALERIDETDPFLAAFSSRCDEEALLEAANRDRDFGRTGPVGPLHGVPISVKDMIATRDALTEGGSAALRGARAGFDAVAVAQLRKAGAIIIGKTVCHEFGFGQNVVRTRNPWNDHVFSGGSSAGSAVSVAVGSSFGSLGTDAGGSVRIPAAFNGVVGMKPSYGRISTSGVMPCAPSLDHVGVLARTVQDAETLYRAASGIRESPAPEAVSGAKALRIGIVAELFETATPQVREVLDRSMHAIAEEVDLVEVKGIDLQASSLSALLHLMAEGADSHRELLGRRGAMYDPATRRLIQAGLLLPASVFSRAGSERLRIAEQYHALFTRNRVDVLLGPTVPKHAFPVDGGGAMIADPDEALDLMVRNTLPANLAGAPAISIPCGTADDGVPVGLMLMAPSQCDSELFTAARLLERLLDWRSAPEFERERNFR